MRYLFLTVGTPASGKTTFINKMGLSKYSVAADDVREMVSNPETKIRDGKYVESVDYQDEGYTWEIIRTLLERRMSQGETTIIDATHLFKGAFSQYTPLINKWNYKLVLIDFMKVPYFDKYNGDTKAILNSIISNDESRGRNIPDDNVFIKYLERYKALSQQKFLSYTVVSPDEFIDKYINDFLVPKDMNEYDTVTIIGDIHGDLSSLKKVFDNHKRGDAYIFVGDYLDRGTDNVGVFNFLKELRGKNITLLRGNHELRMESFTTEGNHKGQFGNTTLPELLRNNVTREDMITFQSRLEDFSYFTFGGTTCFVSHAGIEPGRDSDINAFTNEEEFTKGLTEDFHSPYERDVDKYYLEAGSPVLPNNFHGHRNEFHHDAFEVGNHTSIANLTEYGKFRYIKLHKDGHVDVNDTDRIDEPTFVDTLVADKDVRQNEVPGTDIIAHNFTKEVFRSGNMTRWTPRTLSARGLFTRGNNVVGRGFNKFFNIGENSTATLDSLVYPVEVFNKWNGFLGITFWDKDNKIIRAVTKSGYTTLSGIDDSEFLLNIIKKSNYYNILMEYYADNPDNSVIFEMISPKDPHIIDYGDMIASMPIAVIENSTGKFMRDDEISVFDIRSSAVASNREELDAILNKVDDREDPIEGVVLRGQNKLLKYKSQYYLKAKELRGRLELYNSIGAKKFHEHGYDNDEGKWHYGAHDWFNRAVRDGESFSPRLALKYQEQDEEKLDN